MNPNNNSMGPPQQTFHSQNEVPHRYKMRPPMRPNFVAEQQFVAPSHTMPQFVQSVPNAYGQSANWQPVPVQNEFQFQPYCQTPQYQYNYHQPVLYNPNSNESFGYHYNAPQYDGYGHPAATMNGDATVQNMPVYEYVYTSTGPVPTQNYFVVDDFGNMELTPPQGTETFVPLNGERELVDVEDADCQPPKSNDSHGEPTSHPQQEQKLEIGSMPDVVNELLRTSEIEFSAMNFGIHSCKDDILEPTETGFVKFELKPEEQDITETGIVGIEAAKEQENDTKVSPAKVEKKMKKKNEKKSAPVLSKAEKKAIRKEEDMLLKEALKVNKAYAAKKEKLCKHYLSFLEIHQKLHKDVQTRDLSLIAIRTTDFQRLLIAGYTVDQKSNNPLWKADGTAILKKRLKFHQKNKNEDMEMKCNILLEGLQDEVIQHLYTIEHLHNGFEKKEAAYFEEVFNSNRPAITINEGLVPNGDENRNANEEILKLEQWQFHEVVMTLVKYCRRQGTIRSLKDLSNVKWQSDLEKQLNEKYATKKEDFRRRENLKVKLLQDAHKLFWSEHCFAIEHSIPYSFKTKSMFLVDSLIYALLTVRDDVLFFDVEVLKEFSDDGKFPIPPLIYKYIGLVFEVDWNAL